MLFVIGKSSLNIHWKDVLKLKLQHFGHRWEELLIGKDPDAGKDWRWEEKGTTEDEMVGWHHRLNRHEFEYAPGVGDGQGGLACCSPWGCKQSDTTEWLNWTDLPDLIRRTFYEETEALVSWNNFFKIKHNSCVQWGGDWEPYLSLSHHKSSLCA